MTQFKLDSFLPYQIAVLSTRISAGFSQTYRQPYGLTVAEWRVVAHLSQQDSVSVREIYERVDMDKPKVSRAASRLEAAGYVSKAVNASDRRLVELRLTDKGRDMIEALTPAAREYEERIMDVLGDDGAQFFEQVERLNAFLGNKDG